METRYADHREMFEKEKPDLAQVSTPPDTRLNIIMAAEEAGVPAVQIEKPLAIQGEDYLALREYAASKPNIKVAINHQLQFHPRRQVLQKLVADGAIGDLRFIETRSDKLPCARRCSIGWRNDAAVQPLNLEGALVDFNVILALYASALNHEVVEIPYELETALVQKMRQALA